MLPAGLSRLRTSTASGAGFRPSRARPPPGRWELHEPRHRRQPSRLRSRCSWASVPRSYPAPAPRGATPASWVSGSHRRRGVPSGDRTRPSPSSGCARQDAPRAGDARRAPPVRRRIESGPGEPPRRFGARSPCPARYPTPTRTVPGRPGCIVQRTNAGVRHGPRAPVHRRRSRSPWHRPAGRRSKRRCCASARGFRRA